MYNIIIYIHRSVFDQFFSLARKLEIRDEARESREKRDRWSEAVIDRRDQNTARREETKEKKKKKKKKKTIKKEGPWNVSRRCIDLIKNSTMIRTERNRRKRMSLLLLHRSISFRFIITHTIAQHTQVHARARTHTYTHTHARARATRMCIKHRRKCFAFAKIVKRKEERIQGSLNFRNSLFFFFFFLSDDFSYLLLRVTFLWLNTSRSFRRARKTRPCYASFLSKEVLLALKKKKKKKKTKEKKEKERNGSWIGADRYIPRRFPFSTYPVIDLL